MGRLIAPPLFCLGSAHLSAALDSSGHYVNKVVANVNPNLLGQLLILPLEMWDTIQSSRSAVSQEELPEGKEIFKRSMAWAKLMPLWMVG